MIEKVVTGTIDLDNGKLMDWPLPQQAEEAAATRYAWISRSNGFHKPAPFPHRSSQ